MSIKAVVFDYGQVICFPPDLKFIDVLAERTGVERDKFEALLWPLRNEYDRGTISGREYYRDLVSRFGVSMDDKSIDEMVEIDHKAWRNIDPGTVALMEDVKRAGYILGILSNMPHDFLAWARKNIPVFSLPHAALFSCEVNLIKPEKAIYEKLISMLGVESEELVFFDDNAENVRSAGAMGIRAFLWKGAGNARQELASLGVRV